MHFSGFPLDKAVEYAKLRNPLLLNDLNMQYFIQDRYVLHMHTHRHTQIVPARLITMTNRGENITLVLK